MGLQETRSATQESWPSAFDEYRRVRIAFRAGATSERRKEVSVIAIDVMKGLCDGTIFVRESETKGREGRVESCELDQLHG